MAVKKFSPSSSRVKKPKVKKETPKQEAAVVLKEVHTCSRCGIKYNKQQGNFFMSRSPLYTHNNGFTTVCHECVDELYKFYGEELGSDAAAVKRLCMKFDLYWNVGIFNFIYNNPNYKNKMTAYNMRLALKNYEGKTFDDTLSEESITEVLYKNMPDAENGNPLELTPDIIMFWGGGMNPDFYIEIEQRLRYWCGDDFDRNADDIDPGEIAIIKQICMLEAQINRAIGRGETPEKLVNTLNSLLGSGNFKPNQKKKDAASALAELDKIVYTEWIKKIEDTRPITEPREEYKDVNKHRYYNKIWFLGTLCDVLGIDNKHSEMYREAIKEFTVEKPEYDDDDEEVIFNDILKRSNPGDGNE